MTDLQEAFREAARREFAMVPDEDQLDYTFSPGFQRKMRRIIRAQVHGYWSMVNTLGKRVAIAAAIIVMLLTTAMAIKPVRERVIQFFVEVYEEYFEITFGEDESGDTYSAAEPMIRYTFAWVPEDYYENYCDEWDTLLTTVWTSGTGEGILLTQGAGLHVLTLNHTDDNFLILNHKELIIYYKTVFGFTELIWEQHGYAFKLTVDCDISFNDTLKMIDSLYEIK